MADALLQANTHSQKSMSLYLGCHVLAIVFLTVEIVLSSVEYKKKKTQSSKPAPGPVPLAVS